MERPISTVRRWVTDAIKAIPREAADEVRKQMLDRLDYMMQNLMRAVQDAADSSTISALLQIEDRRAKLLGLYALPDCLDGGGFEVPEILHRRLIERITADAPVLRHDVPIPLKPIM
jgi:hypothetical protein